MVSVTDIVYNPFDEISGSIKFSHSTQHSTSSTTPIVFHTIYLPAGTYILRIRAWGVLTSYVWNVELRGVSSGVQYYLGSSNSTSAIVDVAEFTVQNAEDVEIRGWVSNSNNTLFIEGEEIIAKVGSVTKMQIPGNSYLEIPCRGYIEDLLFVATNNLVSVMGRIHNNAILHTAEIFKIDSMIDYIGVKNDSTSSSTFYIWLKGSKLKYV